MAHDPESEVEGAGVVPVRIRVREAAVAHVVAEARRTSNVAVLVSGALGCLEAAVSLFLTAHNSDVTAERKRDYGKFLGPTVKRIAKVITAADPRAMARTTGLIVEDESGSGNSNGTIQ